MVKDFNKILEDIRCLMLCYIDDDCSNITHLVYLDDELKHLICDLFNYRTYLLYSRYGGKTPEDYVRED